MSKKANLIALAIYLGIAIIAIGAWAETPKKIATSTEEKEYLPEPDEFIAVEQNPVMIYEEVPVYPKTAKKAGLEATVWIKALVNRKGEVAKAFVYKSPRSKDNTDVASLKSTSKAGFEESALKAAYKCKYKPAVKNGQPVAVWVTYSVKFTLSGDNEEDKTTDLTTDK
jgi:protein TonB